jgi:hypothetical protein
MKETVNLPVIRYRDTDGKPTCLSNQGACQFLETRGHLLYLCYLDKPSFAALPIRGRGDGTGSMIPIDKCPLWEGEER